MFDGKLLVPYVLSPAVTISIIIEAKSKSQPLCVPICVCFVCVFHPCQADKNQDDEWHYTRHNVTTNEEVMLFRDGIITKRLQNSSHCVHPLNFATEVGGLRGKNKISISGKILGIFGNHLFPKIFPPSLRVEHFCCTGNNLWKFFLPYGVFLLPICVPKIAEKFKTDELLSINRANCD